MLKLLCENFENELKEAFRFCEGLQVPCHTEGEKPEVSQNEVSLEKDSINRVLPCADKFQGKIIWAEMSDLPCFVYENQGFYINQTCYFIPRDDVYLYAVLNSKLIYFYMQQIASTLGSGSFRWIKQFVEKLPIIQTNAKNKEKITKIQNLTKELINLKQSSENTEHLACKLDSLIYDLYALNENEIKLIESAFANGGGI